MKELFYSTSIHENTTVLLDRKTEHYNAVDSTPNKF